MPTSLKQEFHKNQTITGQFSLNYDRVFNKDHSINGLALVEIIDYNNGNFSAYRENYVTSAIDQLFAGIYWKPQPVMMVHRISQRIKDGDFSQAYLLAGECLRKHL